MVTVMFWSETRGNCACSVIHAAAIVFTINGMFTVDFQLSLDNEPYADIMLVVGLRCG